MFKANKVKAFTLLEALIALFVLSGSVLLFQSMTRLLASEVQTRQHSEQREWLLFADQLEVELTRSSFEKVENNRLYMKQDGKVIAFGKASGQDFRKTNANGKGYQPMVYDVKKAEISRENELVRIRLLFKRGLEREFIYRVETKS
ncbi:competence type IV pilus minor pilin ComGF [Streptococcus intermedius]|uniref:competence type IV pilus minor pilin ComGF n=1 Tax=Streptococcus intermedius TaxID=1338 RepID=UPI00124F4285|nr:competence type IV pilus minor pilin ComGF [Streptococcus intermedius]